MVISLVVGRNVAGRLAPRQPVTHNATAPGELTVAHHIAITSATAQNSGVDINSLGLGLRPRVCVCALFIKINSTAIAIACELLGARWLAVAGTVFLCVVFQTKCGDRIWPYASETNALRLLAYWLKNPRVRFQLHRHIDASRSYAVAAVDEHTRAQVFSE